MRAQDANRRVDFSELKDALNHLSDLDTLNTHPLARLLPEGRQAEPAVPGLRLRALLLQSIDSLKPANTAPATTPEWRSYLILHDRYVLRRRFWDIAHQLSLSERQLRREHLRALQALHVTLQTQWLEAPALATPANLQDAVQRLAPQPKQVALAEMAQDLAEMIVQMQHAGGMKLVWKITPAQLTVFTDRGILRQLLLRLLQLFSDVPQRESHNIFLTAQEDAGEVHLTVQGDALLLDDANDERVQLCQWLAGALGTVLSFTHDPQREQAAFTLPAGGRLPTLFVVDDEPMAIELLRGYLAETPYQLVAESKPERALQRALETKPDVIVLDVMMPGMDGWELFQRLRHEPQLQDVPIVVYSVLNDQAMAQAMGATRFLRKPVLRQQLIQLLQELIPGFQ